MRAIIIDDEPLARTLINDYLIGTTDVEVVGLCEDGFSGLKMIQELQPDLIFLDVQMPRLTGFEMLEVLEHCPLTIFTTAYDQYAIAAFERNAIDYLLKPFSKERLLQAVQRARERLMAKGFDREKIQKLIQQSKPPQQTERIVVKNGTKVKIIPTSEVMYLEAQDDYVMIYTSDGKYLKQQTLTFFEEHLNPDIFIRIHRSYILNMDYLAQIEAYEKDSYRAVTKSKQLLPVSRSGYARVKQKFNI